MSGTTFSLKDAIKDKIATAIKDNLKGEEGEFVNPWSTQDKASVLQQSRCFGDQSIDVGKCLDLLTRVLYIMQQGEKLSAQELTSLFFGVTKLFQASGTRLRRMVYLVIKELEPPDDIAFIVASSLIKDMNGREDCYRANSIRVLSHVLDPSMVAQIDRYLKTAIVDKNPFVASAALLCGSRLLSTVPDIVRRWVNEIQEATTSTHSMVQFHALGLLYELKKTDRLALHKVVTKLAKSQMKSALAECLLIRYATQALLTERDSAVEKALMTYLDNCLRHKAEIVTYEAARALCRLAVADTENVAGHSVFGYDITHATTILQIFLTSPKPAVRFGAIKALNLLAQHRPHTAARCNCDMETLLTDSNCSIRTLALTTLLKTGHESNVERLVKQITSFMSDISDSFKIEVARAVKSLCLQYPSKYKTLMGFLSSNLREDGSAEFKRYLVEAILLIISEVPAARETGLLQLCEFVEDCEYPNLTTRILAFLGNEVPSTSMPSKYIRFINNRLILENALVRAAAVDALTKIALCCESLRSSVLLLLRFGENDNDDEVRERMSLCCSVLQRLEDKRSEEAEAKLLMSAEMPFSMDALYDGLTDHLSSANKGRPFNFANLPTHEAYIATMQAQAALQSASKTQGAGVVGGGVCGVPSAKSGAKSGAPGETLQARAEQKAELFSAVASIVEESALGQLQHSCRPKPLTETEAEYTVQVVKHMFKQHVVLEVSVSNTVQGITLERVETRLTGLGPAWSEIGSSAITRLAYGEQVSSHIVLCKNGGEECVGAVVGSMGAALHFVVKEEGDDLGYEDDYPVENIVITMGDYIFPRPLQQGHFKARWEELTAQGSEATQKLILNFRSLDEAVQGIIQTLNMEPCENTGKVEAGVRGHTLNLSGTFLGGNACLVKALVGMDPRGCVAKITCRSKDSTICDVIANALM